jgi:hypothetical protein
VSQLVCQVDRRLTHAILEPLRWPWGRALRRSMATTSPKALRRRGPDPQSSPHRRS